MGILNVYVSAFFIAVALLFTEKYWTRVMDSDGRRYMVGLQVNIPVIIQRGSRVPNIVWIRSRIIIKNI